MPASTSNYEEIRNNLAAKQAEARGLASDATSTAASAQTFSDQVMQGVRAARASRGADTLSQDIGTVSSQLVTENPGIRARMADVNPLMVDAATSARRGQLLGQLSTIANVQQQREGTVQEIIGAGTNQILAQAEMKKAQAAQAAAEADDLYKQFQMKLDEDKFTLEKEKAAKSGSGGAGALGEQTQALLQKILGTKAPAKATGKTTTKTTKPTAQQPKQKGILQSIFDPVRNYGKLLGEAGFQASRFLTDEAYRKAVLNQPLTPAEAKKLATTKPTKFLNEQEAGSKGKIASYGAKATAGTAALVAPAGKTLKAAIGLGGLAGAGNAYANDENVLAGAAGGAVAGGATRGLLNLLGMGKNVAGTVGQKVRQSVVNPIVADNPFAAEEEKALQKVLSKLGLKGSAAAQREQMPTVFKAIGTKITKKLSSIKKPLPYSDALTMINEKLDNTINFDDTMPVYKKAYDKFINQFTSIANKNGKDNALELTGKSIFEYKKNLGEQLGRAFDKIESRQALTPQEEVGVAIWQSMDGLITKIDKSLKNLTLSQSALYKAAPGLRKSANKSIGVAGITIPGANRVIQAGADLAGRAGEKLSKIPTSGTGADAVTKLSQMLGIGVGEQAGRPAQQGLPVDTTEDTQQEEGTITPDQLKALALADFAETGGKNLGDIEKLGKLLAPTGAKKTEKQLAYQAASEGGQYALELLNGGGVNTGFGQGAIGKIGEVVGFNSNTQQDYRSTIGAVRTTLKNALLGSNMSPSEQASLEPFIPSFDDAENIARQKLTTFIREAQRLAGGNASNSAATDLQSLLGL